MEEHFYLLFPALAVVLLRSVSVRGRVGTLAAFCAATLAWRCALVYGWGAPEVRTLKATDTRLDSIVFGCILALGCNPSLDPPRGVRPATRWAVIAGSVALLTFCLVYRDPRFRETFRYSVQGVGLMGIFYFAIVDHERVYFRWLNWGWVRFVGVLSYSLYLSHLSCQYLFVTKLPSAPLVVVESMALGLTFAFALVMYYAVERPLARLRRKLHKREPVPVLPPSPVL